MMVKITFIDLDLHINFRLTDLAEPESIFSLLSSRNTLNRIMIVSFKYKINLLIFSLWTIGCPTLFRIAWIAKA